MSHEFVMPGKSLQEKMHYKMQKMNSKQPEKKALIVSGKVMERVGNVKVSS